jgi:hypothetical protein
VFARERDEEVVPASVAVRTYEAMGKDPAAKIRAQLLLYVARKWSVVRIPSMREERLEVHAHDAIEHRFGGAAGPVGGREDGHESGGRLVAGVPR